MFETIIAANPDACRTEAEIADVLPKLQAKVIDARLEQVNQAVTHVYAIQSPEQKDTELRKRFQKLQSIADTSYRYQIPVDQSSLRKAEATTRTLLRRPDLSPQTKQVGLIASAKLADLAALRATEAETQVPQGYPIAANVPISGKSVRFKGDHSSFLFNGGSFVIRNSTVVFDGIDFRGPVPFTVSPLILDSKSIVVVRNGTITNLDQTLDGITWVNVQFQHSRIRLNGGPITLVNVSFDKDCELLWLMLGQVGFELKEKITKANGQPITFAFEGLPEHTQKPE